MAIHANWVKDDSRGYVTPGGDPVYICSNCGGGRHVFGVESIGSQPKICKDCGSVMDNAMEIITYGD